MSRYGLKLCGLTRAEDAWMGAELGVDWLGFIFHSASPRQVEPELVADFETGTARRVGVFVDQSPAEVCHILGKARLDLAQLHGGQSLEFCREVGAGRVIKVFWPRRYAEPEDLDRDMDRFAEAAAFFLLESGMTGGGHGRMLDQELLKGLRPSRPWLLAGGLAAASIRGLAGKLPPGLWGFDFNSRVEITPGLKDRRLVAAAIEAVRENEVFT